MICQHCGATISDGDNFCIYCGMAQKGGSASPAQQTIRPVKLNLAKLLGDTFTIYGRHFGTMCMVGLILMGFQTFFEVCGAVTGQIVLFSGFLGLLASCYTYIVAYRQCLYTARSGADFQPNLIFPPFVVYLKLLGLCLVCTCVVVGFAVLLAVALIVVFAIVANLIALAINLPPFTKQMVTIVGVCIFCTVMIYPVVRLWLAYYFLVDRNMGIINSVKTSWRGSLDNFWTLCVGFIIFFGCWFCWIIPCVIVSQFLLGWGKNSVQVMLLINFGSVFLVTIPYLGGALAYLQLTGEPHYLEREKAETRGEFFEQHALEVKNLDV